MRSGRREDWMWYPGMMGFAMWGAGIVLVVLVVAAVAVLAVVLGRRNAQSSNPSPGGDAIEVLRGRYAAGEIDDDEFQRRLATLGNR